MINKIEIKIYKKYTLHIDMDSWEDWEAEEAEVIFVANEEQKKRLEERKLVEESDNALTNDLFSNEQAKVAVNYAAEKKRPTEVKQKPKKQLENEQKQKEASKTAKLLKEMKQRERDIFGEAEDDDEYAAYEDKFY